MTPILWTSRPVEETTGVYHDLASTYDADVTTRSYRTPKRIARALSEYPEHGAVPLGFGCETGLSGLGLGATGSTTVALVKPKGIYRYLWAGDPGIVPLEPSGDLIDACAPEALIVFSLNDPTFKDDCHDAYLERQLRSGAIALVSHIHRPCLDNLDIGSYVILIRRL